MNIDLKGKLAVVTGASGELGRVITRTLADCGADIVIHYHNGEARAKALLKEVQAKGVRAMVVSADITNAKAIQYMKQAIVGELGNPSIIVNNAVIQYKWTTVLEQDVADYEGQFRSCVLQNVLMAKAFAPAMIQRRWGRIIAINTE